MRYSARWVFKGVRLALEGRYRRDHEAGEASEELAPAIVDRMVPGGTARLPRPEATEATEAHRETAITRSTNELTHFSMVLCVCREGIYLGKVELIGRRKGYRDLLNPQIVSTGRRYE